VGPCPLRTRNDGGSFQKTRRLAKGILTQPVHILIRIEPPIAATRSVAGLSFPAHLKIGPARITLPSEHADVQTPTSSLMSGWPPFPGAQPPMPLRSVASMWASSSVRLQPSNNQLNIEALLLRIEMEDEVLTATFPGSTIGEAIEEWLQVARDWLAAWTRSPQDNIESRRHPDLIAVYKTDKWTRITSTGTAGHLMTGTQLVDVDQIRAAFAAASAAARHPAGELRSTVVIPPAYQMFQRALLNYYLGDHRSAVIDACCAAELVMGSIVRRSLSEQGVEDLVCDRIIERASGVVEMFRLYFVAHGSQASDNQVAGQLAGPRNKAAHGGVAPTADELTRAFQLTRLLLGEAHPLPDSAMLQTRARSVLRAKPEDIEG